MSRKKHVPPLAESVVEQDPRFQATDWFLQRAFLALAGVLILLTAAGLFGDGPLSKRRVTSGDVTLTHERFARKSTDIELRLRLGDFGSSPAPRDQAPTAPAPLTVDLRGWILTDAEPPTFIPEPSRQEAIPGGTRYVFDVAPGSNTELIARISPDHAGLFKGELAVAGQTFPLSTLVYP